MLLPIARGEIMLNPNIITLIISFGPDRTAFSLGEIDANGVLIRASMVGCVFDGTPRFQEWFLAWAERDQGATAVHYLRDEGEVYSHHYNGTDRAIRAMQNRDYGTDQIAVIIEGESAEVRDTRYEVIYPLRLEYGWPSRRKGGFQQNNPPLIQRITGRPAD